MATHTTLESLFSDIADAIRDKYDVEDPKRPTTIVADNFPTEISKISTDPSKDATATASDILNPKTAYSGGAKLTGSMPNNGTITITLNTQGQNYTIPKGYHSGSGTVTANVATGSVSVPNTTIEKNPTISWDSENKKITASYSDNKTVSPDISSGYITSGSSGTFYAVGETKVTAVSLEENLTANNIRDGKSLFAVQGTFSDSSTVTGTGKMAAEASHILTGKSAFLDGSQLNGTMSNNGTISASLTGLTNEQMTYTLSPGYYDGGTISITDSIESALSVI